MTEKDKKYAKIAIGAVAAVVLFKIVMPKTDKGGAGDPTGNGGPGSPSNVPFNASSVAEMLYEAMKKSGTNEAKIINVLQSVTPSQFPQVVAKFGKRSYNKTLGSQINLMPWSPLPLLGLQVWLENELSEDQYNILWLKYKPML